MSATLAVLAIAGYGCSSAPSAARSDAGRPSARDTPSVPPTTTSSTTTTVPPAAVSTLPSLPPPPPGWSQPLTTLPPGGGFSSVACISDTFCVASGGGTGGGDATAQTSGSGVTVSWDGAAWSDPSVYFPAPPTGAVTAPILPAVACTSGPSCLIVDGSGHVSTGDGTNWSTVSALSPGTPVAGEPVVGTTSPRDAAIACPSAKFCAVVDSTGNTYTMQGGRWLPTQSLGRSIAAARVGISCPSNSACVAVVGTSVLDWNGSSWSLEPTPWTPLLPDPSGATAIACPTTSLCAIVNGSTLSYRNGTKTWSSLQTIDPRGVLDAITCPSASFCVAADSGGSIVTWNGTSWSSPHQVIPQATEYPGIGTSLACPSVHYCLVMNADGDFATYSAP